ncbi:MAG: TRAP transporter small permease [Parvularculaceae bacterium]
MSELSRRVSLACLWLSGIGLCAMSAIILWQVFARYVLNASPAWSEQLALYLMVWTVLLASAAGVREQFHIRITLLQDRASPGVRRALLIATHLVVGAVGVFLLVAGIDIVGRTWAIAIPTLNLPRGSALIPIPLAGLLIAAFSLEHVSAILRGREVTPLWP